MRQAEIVNDLCNLQNDFSRLREDVRYIMHNQKILLNDRNKIATRPDRNTVRGDSINATKELERYAHESAKKLHKEVDQVVASQKMNKAEFNFLHDEKWVKIKGHEKPAKRKVIKVFILMTNKKNPKNYFSMYGMSILNPDDEHNTYIGMKTAVNDALDRVTDEIKKTVWKKFVAKYFDKPFVDKWFVQGIESAEGRLSDHDEAQSFTGMSNECAGEKKKHKKYEG